MVSDPAFKDDIDLIIDECATFMIAGTTTIGAAM
jgi:hypothetical protein